MHIIENKDVTKNHNQDKKAAWQEILQRYLIFYNKGCMYCIFTKYIKEGPVNNKVVFSCFSFNQLNDTQRDISQLINQWRNTKNNIKKRDFEYRRSRNATGGGPRPQSPPPEDVEIMQLLPKEFETDINIYRRRMIVTVYTPIRLLW